METGHEGHRGRKKWWLERRLEIPSQSSEKPRIKRKTEDPEKGLSFQEEKFSQEKSTPKGRTGESCRGQKKGKTGTNTNELPKKDGTR